MFIELATIVLDQGGTVSFEWPAYCTGWGVESLAAFFTTRGFGQVVCHGCSLGLQHRGRPVKKPWRVASTHRPILDGLAPYRCVCAPGAHVECSGKIAAESEKYTVKMAEVIVNGALAPGMQRACAGYAHAASAAFVPAEVPAGILDMSYAEYGEKDLTETDRCHAAKYVDGGNEDHRCKDCGYYPSFYGLVVRSISPSSAEFLKEEKPLSTKKFQI